MTTRRTGRPRGTVPTVVRYRWTAVYLCAMTTLTFFALIFDWKW